MRIALILVALYIAVATQAQTVYLEDFELTDSSGITGPCDSTPVTCAIANIPSGSGWTLTGNTAQFENALDWMRVVNGVLEARDLGGEVCFASPWMDISDYGALELALAVSEVGDLESSDYVDVYVNVDGNLILVPTVIGEDSMHTIIGDYPGPEDWGDTTVLYSGIQGDSVSVVVCVRNNSSDEKIRIDDITLIESLPDAAPGVFISELDCDQAGVDTADFVELAGPADQELTGYVLVLFNGADDASYAAYDLNDYVLSETGFFTVCFGNQQNAYCDLNVSGGLQNGPDGVGLYYGRSAEDFPNDTPIDTSGLVDGLRYSTSDPIDSGLALLDLDLDCGMESCQIDEDLDGNGSEVSIQRGSWFLGPPTPGALNFSPLPVRLLNFLVMKEEQARKLRWVTSGEVHNDRFEVQRRSIMEDFKAIGQVAGAHFSTTQRDYLFVDSDPMDHGEIMYRLKIIAEDGSAQFSPIVAVVIDSKIARVAPTLSSGEVCISLEEMSRFEVSVISLTGNQVYHEAFEWASHARLDLSYLDPAVYIVVVESSDGITTHQIVLF